MQRLRARVHGEEPFPGGNADDELITTLAHRNAFGRTCQMLVAGQLAGAVVPGFGIGSGSLIHDSQGQCMSSPPSGAG